MPPKVFISYSWDTDAHQQWVIALAERLRGDKIETRMDHWHAPPGSYLPEFMEREIRENEFVLVICTPEYRDRANDRTKGVGYENDLMAGEKLADGKRNKFIPILRAGTWATAVPSWLKGVAGIDLTGAPYSEKHYEKLKSHLLGHAGSPPSPLATDNSAAAATDQVSGGALPSISSGPLGGGQLVYNYGTIENQVNVTSGTVTLNLSKPSSRKKER